MFSLLLPLIYLSFISLGLPDAVLGAAWPLISPEMEVPLSYMGIVSMIISGGTISSSLWSHRLIHKLGVAWVCSLSVGLTALGLWGFSLSSGYLWLCVWAIPYGLGAGSIDAALNNYVALHYESRHMSWLHCMWGVGASLGPYILSGVLLGGGEWRDAYVLLALAQGGLTLVLLLCHPLWKGKGAGEEKEEAQALLSLSQVMAIPGVKELAITFFGYCALEQVTGMWAASYLVYDRGLSPEVAASYTALFYLGITLGRGLSGFITLKYSDKQMILGGFALMGLGLVTLYLPVKSTDMLGLLLVGLGAAPIYPCIIHSIPGYFGAEQSQAVTGVQMASAYVGSLTMPFFFGLVADWVSVSLYPLSLALLLLLMVQSYGALGRKIV